MSPGCRQLVKLGVKVRGGEMGVPSASGCMWGTTSLHPMLKMDPRVSKARAGQALPCAAAQCCYFSSQIALWSLGAPGWGSYLDLPGQPVLTVRFSSLSTVRN